MTKREVFKKVEKLLEEVNFLLDEHLPEDPDADDVGGLIDSALESIYDILDKD